MDELLRPDITEKPEISKGQLERNEKRTAEPKPLFIRICEDNAKGGLDPYAPRELVQAIYVDAPDKSSGKRQQTVRIKYNGIGLIPLEELMKKAAA